MTTMTTYLQPAAPRKADSRNNKRRRTTLLHGLQIIAGVALASLAVSQAHIIAQHDANTSSASAATMQPVGQRSTEPAPADLAQRAAPSIYMVGVVNDAGGFSQIGTGFAIEDNNAWGLVATNAHVADALNQEIARGLRPVVRRPGAESPIDFDLIAEPRIHPGYERWNDLSMRGMLRHSASGPEQFQLISPADVALLRTEPGLGSTLALASIEQASALRSGNPVVYLGFPGEGMVGPRVNAPPLVGVGSIAAMSGVALEFTSPADSLIVQHTVLFTGGSSGGPLVMADPSTGEPMVVAVHSAANHIHFENTRVPVTNSFAQRVDFLQEMIDGDAQSNQIRRDHEWMSVLDRVAIPIVDRLKGLASAVDPAGLMRMVNDDAFALNSESSAESGEHVIRISVQRGRTYAIVATSDNWADVDIVVSDGRRVLAEDRQPDAFPVVRWVSQRNGEITIRFTAPGPSGATNVEYQILEGGQSPPSRRKNG